MMTRKEIIDGLKFTVEMFLFDPITGETFTEPRNDMDKTTIDACKGAIELLEQEPVLDKIRAEIMQLDYDLEYIDYDYDDMAQTDEVHMICREMVLQIIDKYKAESEEK